MEEQLSSSSMKATLKAKAFAQGTCQFLQVTMTSLLDLIVDTGRDRFTYIKEAVIAPTATPPRPELTSLPSACVQGEAGAACHETRSTATGCRCSLVARLGS